MISGGHVASSYLIAVGAEKLGLPISSNEIFQIIIAGNLMDIDFIFGQLTGKTGEAHHQNITHTPLGALILLVILVLLFNPSFHLTLLFLVSLLLHLVLDDISYWIYKLKLFKTPANPQINWLYPITPFCKNKLIVGNKKVLGFYLFKVWPVAILELLLIITAITIYLLSK